MDDELSRRSCSPPLCNASDNLATHHSQMQSIRDEDLDGLGVRIPQEDNNLEQFSSPVSYNNMYYDNQQPFLDAYGAALSAFYYSSLSLEALQRIPPAMTGNYLNQHMYTSTAAPVNTFPLQQYPPAFGTNDYAGTVNAQDMSYDDLRNFQVDQSNLFAMNAEIESNVTNSGEEQALNMGEGPAMATSSDISSVDIQHMYNSAPPVLDAPAGSFSGSGVGEIHNDAAGNTMPYAGPSLLSHALPIGNPPQFSRVDSSASPVTSTATIEVPVACTLDLHITCPLEECAMEILNTRLAIKDHVMEECISPEIQALKNQTSRNGTTLLGANLRQSASNMHNANSGDEDPSFPPLRPAAVYDSAYHDDLVTLTSEEDLQRWFTNADNRAELSAANAGAGWERDSFILDGSSMMAQPPDLFSDGYVQTPYMTSMYSSAPPMQNAPAVYAHRHVPH
ncbi:hypothetical protein EW145_g5771 [Phellinidium pouzarii]|uniref:Uncharacterized protein n=1 Tax=Phellinidium pouzarii TaxID=167371 RepID=A0A4S4KYW1_9AGAM|nr:hypothetical protein EW145_g5771 [Phellinidium pouzarii]